MHDCLIVVVEARRAGAEPALGALAAEIEIEAIDLAPGVDADGLLRAAGVLACPGDHAEDRLGVGPVEGEEPRTAVRPAVAWVDGTHRGRRGW